MADSLSNQDLRRFAEHFGELASRVGELLPTGDGDSIAELAAQHLGVDPGSFVFVGQNVPVVDRPNLQLAINEVITDDAVLLGFNSELAHHGGFSLSALLTGSFRGPGRAEPASFDDVPIGTDEQLRCPKAALWLTRHDNKPVIIGMHTRQQHNPGPPDLRVEVVATDDATAGAVVDRLTEARQRLNVYRGKVLAFTFSQFGEFGIDFIRRPTTREDEVVLPAEDLNGIRRHAIEIAAHADAMRQAGQHLRRGLLLYGPPGTGKTHTVGHLMAAMPNRTVVTLNGPSVAALGHAAAIVRALPPSMLVIEDVDLIATERSFHPMGGNGLLFQLLNEMDGLNTVDDVLFVLTTNRIDMLEPALAARPGRIDHAVEIGPPDAEARHKLLALFLRDIDHDLNNLDDAVQRLDGVTGAFIKELIRRAVAASIMASSTRLTDAHLADAITDMLDADGPLRAAMLGGPRSMQQNGPMGGAPPFGYGVAPPGFTSFTKGLNS